MAPARNFSLPLTRQSQAQGDFDLAERASGSSGGTLFNDGSNPYIDPESQKHQGTVSSTSEADVFANEEGAAIQYKTMTWWHAGWLMLAETISLGVLALPQSMATLGFLPGVIIITFFGILATYTGCVIGDFKLLHPGIHCMGDAAELVAGRVGKEIVDFAQNVVLIFICAAHVLAFSIMMNVVTEHGTCSIVFSFIGFVVCSLLSLPRTMQKVSHFSVVSSFSAVVAVLTTMVTVAVMKPNVGDVVLAAYKPLATSMVAVLNIVMAFSGHVTFFGFASEMKKPEDFKKAVFLLQGVATSFYITVACVIYYYGGSTIPAPALSAVPPLLRKVVYGIATPTIVVAGVINGHVACKSIYVRFWRWRNAAVVHQSNVKSLGSWYFIVAVIWALAFLIAIAIPLFGEMLALVSALFCGWFSFGLSGIFWLHMNKGVYFINWKKRSLFALNVGVIVIGGIICVLGLYASGKAINENGGAAVFSCKDNAPLTVVTPLRPS